MRWLLNEEQKDGAVSVSPNTTKKLKQPKNNQKQPRHPSLCTTKPILRQLNPVEFLYQVEFRLFRSGNYSLVINKQPINEQLF